MHEINFVDKSFDLKQASEYHLSIQLGLDGFSFCILDQQGGKYILFRHIPATIGKVQFLPRKVETIFEQEEVLNAVFRSVTIVYSSSRATLIPKTFANPEIVALIAAFTDEMGKNEETLTNDLPGLNYQVAFSIPKELIRLFNRKYTEFRVMHQCVPLLATCLEHFNEKRNSLLIHFEKNHIRVVLIKGHKLHLFNSFFIKNEVDFLYYTLNICQSQQIDPHNDEVFISGQVANDSAYIRQLKKYQHNISCLKPDNRYSYGSIFEKDQKHQFTSLLNSFLCA